MQTTSAEVQTLCERYSTTRLCYRLLGDRYLDKNGRVKEDVKFGINVPDFRIKNSKVIGNPRDSFETLLFLPEGKQKKGEGGLRTRGYFKFSYKKDVMGNGHQIKEEWYVVDGDDNPIKRISLPSVQYFKCSNWCPLITVVTVVYNGEKTLEETVKSVINQTYPNVEYIIIDGGSNDGTLDIIKRYEDKIDYWVSEDDKGIYDAMNKGVKLAKGKFVLILNSDDVYFNDTIAKMVSKITHENCDYLFAQARFSGEKSLIRPIFPLRESFIYQEMMYPHVSALIPLKVYKKVGLFDPSLKIAGDYDMAIRIHLGGFEPYYLKEVVAELKEGGISNSLEGIQEVLQVAIRSGKDRVSAYVVFYIQAFKYMLQKILPKSVIRFLRKVKRSRYR